MATTRTKTRTWTGKPSQRRPDDQEGTASGSFLSDFALPDLGGRTIRISDQTGHPYILLFVGPDCEPSHSVLQELNRLRRKPNRSILPLLIVSSGGRDGAAQLAAKFDLGDEIAYQENAEVMTFFRIPATPAAHEVDATRRTVGPLAIGSHAVIGLLRGKPAIGKKQRGKHLPQNDSTPRPKRVRPKLVAGTIAPDITLAAPEGYSVTLATRTGSRTLVLFWSSHCPSCEALLELLSNAASINPELEILIVGRDGDERLDALPQAPNIVFGTQDRRSASYAYGIYKSPAAVLIDHQGRLERDPATGLAEVRSLMSSLH